MPNPQKKDNWDSPTCLFWLRLILAVYIVLCFLIAGLNFGYAKQADPAIAKWITWFWHFYENWIKTAFVLIGAYLTLRIVRRTSRATLRKSNLIGLSVTALVVHILLPLLLDNPELYLFSMPLPWNSAPLQILNPTSPMYQKYLASWSSTGIHLVLLYQVLLSLVVMISTLLFGRRAQCSTLCLFNGFASEVFSPAFPLIGKPRKPKPATLRILKVFQWIFLAMALFFTLYWLFVLFIPSTYLAATASFLGQLEIYKYLLFELILMMLFWIFFIGRGYCTYCPLGTLLGYISRLSKQRIETDRSKCIQCGKCNQTCPMSIHIMEKAREKAPVTDLNCVGCGHCVDICPTQTLTYTTVFLKKIQGGQSQLSDLEER